MIHLVRGQCVYTFQILFARCKACDGQDKECRCYTPRKEENFHRPAGKEPEPGGNMTAQAGDSCPCRDGRVEYA